MKTWNSLKLLIQIDFSFTNFNNIEDDNKFKMAADFPSLPVHETPLFHMSPEEVFQAIRMGDIILNDYCLNDAGQLELIFTRLMQMLNRTKEQSSQVINFLNQTRELAIITYPHPIVHVATDEKAEFDDEGLCVYPLSRSRIRRNVEASASTSNQRAREETPPPSDPIPVAIGHYIANQNNDECSCGSGNSKCCRKCCEIEEHWLVSDSSDEVESDYSCYNDEPDQEENATTDQVEETVEIEGNDDEVEFVMEYVDLTFENNNPQIQFHPAPTPTPPLQCPCRSPPGPLATSTPRKKPKLEWFPLPAQERNILEDDFERKENFKSITNNNIKRPGEVQCCVFKEFCWIFYVYFIKDCNRRQKKNKNFSDQHGHSYV